MSEEVALSAFDQGWFVVQTYSGYEKKVKEDLLERADTYNMADKILRIEIPTEMVWKEVNGKVDKNGKKEEKQVESNMFPGYVLVEMNMTDEAWFVVRNTPNVTGFVGSHGNRSKPTPLFEEEIEEILASMQGNSSQTREISFDVFVGKKVRIIDGPFKGAETSIVDIVYGEEGQEKTVKSVKVEVDAFGRKTIANISTQEIEEIEN
ncbi:MAG: transcription termination/antitermination protein NusG [Lactovum sp.]